MQDVYWLHWSGSGRVGILPRPRGGDWLCEDLRRIRAAGADTLVSLLEAEEVRELGLCQESEAAAAQGLRFVSFPIADRQVPRSEADFRAFVEPLSRHVDDGGCVAIHCRAGIGRSSLTAVAVLAFLSCQRRKALSSQPPPAAFPFPTRRSKRPGSKGSHAKSSLSSASDGRLYALDPRFLAKKTRVALLIRAADSS